MIAFVRGQVLAAGAGWVVVDVGPGGAGGGVGMRLEVPGRLSGAHPGAELALHTHLVVREDSLTLFGFATAEELDVFGILLGVSGVGPRSALGVLTELTPAIAQAAASEDEKPFRKVSGIGPKTAKLIAVQLAGKLDPLAFGGTEAEADETPGGRAIDDRAAATVVQGLLGLGYGEAQAETAVQDARSAGAPNDEAGLLRAALALLQAPRLPSDRGAR
ncbi:Holliday junction branch migration protein RuvA [Leucobacter soli]|uniref:Holliday junction branch migration protein RuvA n=1 Tax=Leucobacter soli TaxID=2812850 RepID=UPI00360F357C